MLRMLVLLAVVGSGVQCSNAAYEIIKPRKEDKPDPGPTPLPTPSYPPNPTPTGEPTPGPTPLPTPTFSPIPIPTDAPLPPIPTPDPTEPFPPPMPPCPGDPCLVKNTEIIIALDTSISMRNKISMIQRNINGIIQFFSGFPNIGFSIIGSNNNCSETHIIYPFNPSIKRFDACIGSHNAISRVNAMLQATAFPAAANIEIIIISDDNGGGFGNLAIDFKPVIAVGQRVRVSSVIGVNMRQVNHGPLYCFSLPTICTYDAVGLEYIRLSQMTGAGAYNICNSNWAPLVEDILRNIR